MSKAGVTLCVIHCDTHNCTHHISIPNDVSHENADQIARLAGWQVTTGAKRSYHRCTFHGEDIAPSNDFLRCATKEQP